MTTSKRKEAPSEPFKRALEVCTRAVAGDADVHVSYQPGRPELVGKDVHLPEPSRVPTKREIAIIRGWADSLALTAACHDVKLHARLAPGGGEARSVFEAVERARVEALGANRMSGMARNLAAKTEEQYAHGRFAHVKTKEEAPLEDALALMLRERLTGEKPPANAQAIVDVWRSTIDKKAARVLDRLQTLGTDQEQFGRVAQDLLKALDLVEDKSSGSSEQDVESDEENEDGCSEEEQETNDGGEGKDQPQDESKEEGTAGEQQDSVERADTDQFDADNEGLDEAETPEPWRPNQSVLDHPERFGYSVYTKEFDETVAADDLASPEELDRLRAFLDKELKTLASVISRLANKLQRKLLAQQNRAWDFDLDEGALDAARLMRVIIDPMAPLTFKRERDTDFKDTVVTLLIDNSGSMRGRPIMVAAVCADILARTLERCGVRV
ncbi:MAG: cobaltochelatase CobT-related protein, partial [Hyphomicrobiaceae bacterium]